MAKTKALLVGVSRYFLPGCTPLPKVTNDLCAMKDAIIRGLNISDQS